MPAKDRVPGLLFRLVRFLRKISIRGYAFPPYEKGSAAVPNPVVTAEAVGSRGKWIIR
jgi:hypothetical protein